MQNQILTSIKYYNIVTVKKIMDCKVLYLYKIISLYNIYKEMSGDNVLDLQIPPLGMKVSCSLNSLNSAATCQTNQNGKPGPTYDISISNPPNNNNSLPSNNSDNQLNSSVVLGDITTNVASNNISVTVSDEDIQNCNTRIILDESGNLTCPKRFTCPTGSSIQFDSLGNPGCSIEDPTQFVICPHAYNYEIVEGAPRLDGSIPKHLKCSPINGLTYNLSNYCKDGYKKINWIINQKQYGNVVYSLRYQKCVPIQSSTFTSNVYDFKSKKERRIENFSENGKCKARY